MKPTTRTTNRPPVRWLGRWIALLLFTLLYSGLVGSAHGVLHAASRSDSTAASPSLSASAIPASWLDRLVGHQSGDKDCGAFDELLPDIAPLLPALPLPVAPELPPLVAATILLSIVPLGLRAFEARAPPVCR